MKFLTEHFRRGRPTNSGDGVSSDLVLKAPGPFTPLRRRLLALKTWPLLLLSLGLVRAEPPVAPKTARETARTSNSVPTTVPTPHRLVIEGEPMVVRTVTDTQQGGLAVGVLMVPEKWRFNSQVSWTYENYSSPVKISTSAENPDNEEAYYAFPVLEFFCLRPRTGFFRPWQNSGGMLFAERQPPLLALEGFVRQARSRFPKFEIIGTKELPDLAAALQIPKAENQRGIGLKVTYELKGTLVEEEFYAIGFSIDIPYDGPQGRTWQNNWGLYALHSFRAPQGGLERRRPIFAAMTKSFRPNPAWQQRKGAIFASLAEQFNRNLQAGYDSIAAAGRLSRQISANNDAMIAGIDRQLQASRNTSSGAGRSTGVGGSSGRSSTDQFDDYVRGVDTVNDPYYGTSQHASTEQYHWTDGYGSYRHSNDASADPNHTEVGTWQRMEPAR